MEEKQGHRILASLCTAELDELKRKRVHNVQFSATEKYALCHSARHMFYSQKDIRRDRLEELTKTYVTDLELLFAKLCVSSTIAAEDIIWFQKQGISSLLSEDIQIILNTLKLLLRKYHDIFKSHPHLLWQNVLNEGGAVLSGEASNLLQKKYPEIPYMDCIHKESQQGRVLAQFQCSDEVVCVDVSLKLDYMVCECKGGMIQLWSLRTGELLWTLAVQVPKSFEPVLRFRTRWSWSKCSCYRSVVFHPTEDLILPGILSHAYTIEGDLKPLFVESSCRFSVCSVSGDKTKLLTNSVADAKCLLMSSLENGAEISRITRDEDIVSFAWSQDGTLLAISHSTGSICLLDVKSDFIILAETTLQEVCGMLKFSPNNRVLFCVLTSLNNRPLRFRDRAFHVNVTVREESGFSLIVSNNDYESLFDLKECDFVSDCGFLVGDPISTSTGKLYFVLDKHTALTGVERLGSINMVSTDTDENIKPRAKIPSQIALSLDCETVFVVEHAGCSSTLVTWNVSSGKLIAEKNIEFRYYFRLVCVREGVLLQKGDDCLELWWVGLSECIRRWTNLSGIRKVIPVSDERVACVTEEGVTVLDTTSGNILSRIPAAKVVGCNSKLQILTTDGPGLCQLSDGTSVFWERKLPTDFSSDFTDAIFSPTEQFVIIYHLFEGFILDVMSGNTLHTLRPLHSLHLGKGAVSFVSDEDYVVAYSSSVQLCNVKSGDLLSEMNIESRVTCLAVCPSKRLFAIGLKYSNPCYKVIQVWLPGDKDHRKSKRVDNTVETV